MFVVNETGAKIMQFSSDFNKYARDVLHIDNPIILYHRANAECFTRQNDGTIQVDLDKSRIIDKETKVSREEWIQLRNKYVAERILRELGYEVLEISNYREYLQDVIPCEGATGQCSFFCPKYFECGL